MRRAAAVLLTLLASMMVVTPATAAPAGCSQLGDAALEFDAPHLTGAVAAGMPICFELDEVAGTVLSIGSLRADVSVRVSNAEHEQVCLVAGTGTCLLPGPVTLTILHPYDDPTPYDVQVFRLTGSTGCPVLEASAFGDTASHVIEGELGPNATECRAVQLDARPHLLRALGGLRWTLHDTSGAEVCAGDRDKVCSVPSSGRHHLVFRGGYSYWEEPAKFSGTLFDLSSTAGCGGVLTTNWVENPTTRVATTSKNHVDCRALEADPGERIAVEAQSGPYGTAGKRLVVDPTGTEACVQTTNVLGCELTGTGPFRVITWVDYDGWYPERSDYDVVARNVGPDSDCPVIAARPFGTTPDDHFDGVGCRQFQATAGQRLLISTIYAGGSGSARLYGPSFEQTCGSSQFCTMPATGRYLTITDLRGDNHQTALHDLSSTEGCVELSVDLSQRGATTTAGEVPCSLLTVPVGSRVAVVQPDDTPYEKPAVRLVDSKGAVQCSSYQATTPVSVCAVGGTPPYKAVIGEGAPTPYLVAFMRPEAPPQNCGSFPATAFGGATWGSSASLDEGQFVRCLNVPTDPAPRADIFSYDRISGGSKASFALVTETPGNCGNQTPAARTIVHCGVRGEYGRHTALVIGDGSPAAYRLRRYDTSSGAAGCTDATSTDVGGPSTARALADGLDFACVRVPAKATDKLWFDVRDAAGQARLMLFDAEGDYVCQTYGSPCLAEGQTSYQAVIRMLEPAPATAQIDTWKIQTSDGYAPQCKVYDDYSTGFGPTETTLSNAHSGLCLVLPNAGFDEYSVQVQNTAGGSVVPEPRQIRDGEEFPYSCYDSNPWLCRDFAPWPHQTGLVMFALPDGQDQLPIRVTGHCASGSNCGANTLKIADFAPKTATTGSTVRVSLTGGKLYYWSRVRLVREGYAPVLGTVVDTSRDNQSLSVDFDLTGVAPGPWKLEVENNGVTKAAKELTVLAGRITFARTPAVAGTPRVDRVLSVDGGATTPTATSLSYQWLADGAAIPRATASSYRVPAGLLGKRISVRVTAERQLYQGSTATTRGLVIEKGSAPLNVKRPVIKGDVIAGRRVWATHGRWNKPPSGYAYRWFVSGRRIDATGDTIRLKQRWKGKPLVVVVVAQRAGCFSGRARSSALTVR